jgi:hypothetical protein
MCKQITDSVDAQLLSTRDRIDAIEAHLAALGACTANASQEVRVLPSMRVNAPHTLSEIFTLISYLDQVYVEMSKGADVTAQAARASGAIKSATGAAVAASVSPAAPLAPSLAQKRAAGQVERVLTLNAVKRELAAVRRSNNRPRFLFTTCIFTLELVFFFNPPSGARTNCRSRVALARLLCCRL